MLRHAVKDPEHVALLNHLKTIRNEIDQIAALLPAAYDARWTASLRNRNHQETPRRTQGTHSDPTADVAIDTQRLDLSEAVSRLQTVTRFCANSLATARNRMACTIDAWEGVSDDATE